MNITWLDINSSYSHSSLAIPALESQLDEDNRKKCHIHVVSGTIKTSADTIISEVLDSLPHYILATGWLFNIDYLLSVLSRVCAVNPGIRVVLGGPEFLGNNEDFLRKNRYVTSVFKGDGEEVFNNFINIISNNPSGYDWLELDGFEYIDTGGKYVSKDIVVVKDFISLNPPEESVYFRWDKAFVQIETSRGCFNSCKFCVSGIDSSPVQNIPIAKIRERLDKMEMNGIKEIRVLDRTFNGNSTRAVEMLDLFEEYSGRMKFHIEVHPALLAPIVKEKLKNMPPHILHIEAGIQSLDEDVLCKCARKGTAAKAADGLNFLIRLNRYEVHTDFIAGLPGYNFGMLVSDVKRMIGIAPHEIQLELLKLLPGTIFRKHAEELGIKYSPLPPYEVLQTDDITYKELTKCKLLSKIIEYWYNDPQWRETFRELVISSEVLLERLLDYLSKS